MKHILIIALLALGILLSVTSTSAIGASLPLVTITNLDNNTTFQAHMLGSATRSCLDTDTGFKPFTEGTTHIWTQAIEGGRVFNDHLVDASTMAEYFCGYDVLVDGASHNDQVYVALFDTTIKV